jgi:hypothetical protein
MTGYGSGDRNEERRTKSLDARLGLIGFDQIANALGVGFAVAVAGDGVGAAGGFDDDLGPEDAGGDVDRGNLGHANAFFVAAEKARFDAGDALRADDEAGGKEEVALGPAAGGEGLGGGAVHGIGGECGHGSVRELESLRSAVPPGEAVPRPTVAVRACIGENF